MAEFFDFIPRNRALMLIGPTGSAKTEFCIDLMKRNLDAGEKVLSLVTDIDPLKIRTGLLSRDVDMKKHQLDLIIIDCFTAWIAGGKEGDDQWSVDKTPTVEALKVGIDKAVLRLFNPANVFIDTASAFFKYNNPKDVIGLLGQLCNRIGKDYESLIFTIHDGTHDPETMNELRSIVDGTIEILYEGARKSVRYLASKPDEKDTGWLRFRVTEQGIRFYTTGG